jgi:histidinol phosphatase-like PHP family hydrolase
MIDLHTHSTFSDGCLIPAELCRRAAKAGYSAVAITDHADHSNIRLILENLLRFGRQAGPFLERDVLAGVEITHVPPPLIPDLITTARELGAQIVVVHGETIVEPVLRGTNLAAIEGGADILAHPAPHPLKRPRGREKNVALELTTRKGHSLTNGLVAALAKTHGAKLVIDNDAHEPATSCPWRCAKKIAKGAGSYPRGLRPDRRQRPDHPSPAPRAGETGGRPREKASPPPRTPPPPGQPRPWTRRRLRSGTRKHVAPWGGRLTPKASGDRPTRQSFSGGEGRVGVNPFFQKGVPLPILDSPTPHTIMERPIMRLWIGLLCVLLLSGCGLQRDAAAGRGRGRGLGQRAVGVAAAEWTWCRIW